MKQYLPLLSLPLVALAQPAYAQECDAECERLESLERDLVDTGTRRAPLPDVVAIEKPIIVSG